MRGRTNITQRDYPFVKGQLVSATVEGSAIGVGDFVEVAYDTQRTQFVQDARMVKLNYTSGTDAVSTSDVASLNPTVFDISGGYILHFYKNNVPTIYFIKEESNALVVKDSLSWTKDRADQAICKLGDNLFAIVRATSSSVANITLYKIQNNAITQVYKLDNISTTTTSSARTYLSICKLNSSQMLLALVSTATSETTVVYDCMLYYYIIDFTSTTLAVNGSLKSYNNSFSRYRYLGESSINFYNPEDNKILMAFHYYALWEFTNSSGTLSRSRANTTSTVNNNVTYGGRFLLNNNKVLIHLGGSSGYVARYYLDESSISYTNKKFTDIGAQGQALNKIADDTFVAAFWDDYFENIGVQIFKHTKSTGNIDSSNKVTFQPNFRKTGSSTVTSLMPGVFGVFLKFGNNIYYIYGDIRQAMGTANPDYDLYYQKIKYENNILTIGTDSNRVKPYSGNGFILGFSKTAGEVGQTITVYKPSL